MAKDKKLSPCGLKVMQIYNMSPSVAKILDNVTEEFIGSADRSEIFVAKNKIAEELVLEANAKLSASIDSIAKLKSAMNRINHPSVATDPSQGLMSLLERTSSVAKGFGVNLENLKDSYSKRFKGKLATDLRKLNFETEFKSAAFDTAIMDHLLFNKPYEGANKEAVIAVANSLNTSYNIMLHEARANGILVNEVKGYVGPIIHDRDLVGSTPTNEWISDVARSLNLEKQFPLIPKEQVAQFSRMLSDGIKLEDIDSKNAVMSILKGSYDKIKGEVDDNYNFGYESIEQRLASPRKFTEWNSSQDLQTYLNKYSKYKTLAERHDFYTNRMTSNISKVAMFGARPEQTIDALLSMTKKKLSDAGWSIGDIKDTENNFRIQYDRLTGSSLSQASKLGEYYATTRKLTANALLGKAGLTSAVLDTLSSTIQKNVTWNEMLIPAMFKSVFDRFGAIPEALNDPYMEQKYLLHKNQLSASFQDLMEGSPSNKILNVSNFVSGIASFADYMNRNAHIAAARANLERLASVNMDNVHPRTKAILDKFGITQEDVNLLQHFNVKEMGMMDVNNASVGDILRIKPELTSKQAADLLSDFKTKMNAFMTEETLDAAKRPDAWTYRKIFRDSKEGTLEGEFRRTAFQMKSTMIAAMRDYGPSNLRKLNFDQDQSLPITQYFNNKNTYWYAGKFAASSMVAGLGLIYMNAVMSRDEKTLDAFSKQDPRLLVAGAARGGMGFFLTDMLEQRDAKSRIASLAGPMASFVAGPIADLISEPFKDKHKPVRESIEAVKKLTPASNQWLMRDFFDGIEHEFGEITGRQKKNLLD